MIAAHLMGFPVEEGILQLAPAGAVVTAAVITALARVRGLAGRRRARPRGGDRDHPP